MKKAHKQGNDSVYKARLVVRGCQQKAGKDFADTYAPVARMPAIRLLFAISLQFGFDIQHLDVKTAFLHGYFDEQIFLHPLDGVDVPSGHALKLQEKQNSNQWNKISQVCHLIGVHSTIVIKMVPSSIY